jgi:hypothetical protein
MPPDIESNAFAAAAAGAASHVNFGIDSGTYSDIEFILE